MGNLIGSTERRKGLKVYSQIEYNEYPARIKVSGIEMGSIRLFTDFFHSEWNYEIRLHN
jgi:hypothetical protein